jgi:hypothetical protein
MHHHPDHNATVWQPDQVVKVTCPKPKPIVATLTCIYEAQDGTMFKWPGNGAKQKPRLSKELACNVFAKTVPANTALTGTVKIVGGKGKPQTTEARDMPGGGVQAETAFSPSNGDFDECQNFTLAGSLVDGQGVTRWTGSLKVAQTCPD